MRGSPGVSRRDKAEAWEAEVLERGRTKRGKLCVFETEAGWLRWRDKAPPQTEQGRTQLARVSAARLRGGVVSLVLAEGGEVVFKPGSGEVHGVFRGLVEEAAARQGVSCASVSRDYFQFSSPGSKMSPSGEWSSCFFGLQNGALLVFSSAIEEQPMSSMDVSTIAQVKILGREETRVLLEVVRTDGGKRLMGVESKAVAEEWKKHLTTTTKKTPALGRASSSSNSSSRNYEDEGNGDDDSDSMEMPIEGSSELDWGMPESVSEVSVEPLKRDGPPLGSSRSNIARRMKRN